TSRARSTGRPDRTAGGDRSDRAAHGRRGERDQDAADPDGTVAAATSSGQWAIGRTAGKWLLIHARQTDRFSANDDRPAALANVRGPNTIRSTWAMFVLLTTAKRSGARERGRFVRTVSRAMPRSVGSLAIPALRTLSSAARTSICWRRARPKSLSPFRLRAKISASFGPRWLRPAGRPQPRCVAVTQYSGS